MFLNDVDNLALFEAHISKCVAMGSIMCSVLYEVVWISSSRQGSIHSKLIIREDIEDR